MCIMMVLHKRVPDYPLVLAANRDEFYNRPACPPHRLRHCPTVWGGKDTRAGGTWLGINRYGVLVGLTNRRLREDQPTDPQRRSRGLVCLDALQCRSALEAADFFAHEPANRYNPFNLLIGDQHHLLWTTYDDEATIHHLEPGLHILSNSNLNDLDKVRIRRAHHLLQQTQQSDFPTLLPILEAICRDHEAGVSDRETICMHHADATYGTVSSTIVALSATPALWSYRYAPGHPCTTPYRDYSALFTVS